MASVCAAVECVQRPQHSVGSHSEDAAPSVGAATCRGGAVEAAASGRKQAGEWAVAIRIVERRKGSEYAVRGHPKDGAGVTCSAARCGAVEIPIRPQHQTGVWLGAICAGK